MTATYASFKDIMDQVHKTFADKEYSRSTIETYSGWIERFLSYCDDKNASLPTSAIAKEFINHLVASENIASSTLNQAAAALIFLFRNVLDVKLNTESIRSIQAHKRRDLPQVLTKKEMETLFANLGGDELLVAQLLYGAGLKLKECLNLRICDLDFECQEIIIRNGVGHKERFSILPASLYPTLVDHLAKLRILHARDMHDGLNCPPLPPYLAKKFRGRENYFEVYYLFPDQAVIETDRATGKKFRPHIPDGNLQKSLKVAVQQAEIPKKVSAFTLRHTFATHLLMQGVTLKSIQNLLGHKDISRTVTYLHILQETPLGPLQSPLDSLH